MAEIIEDLVDEENYEEPEFTDEQVYRQDEVENACYMVAEVFVNGNTEQFYSACCMLAGVMSEEYNRNFTDEMDLISKIAICITDIIEQYLSMETHHLESDEAGDHIRWDMEYVGEMADDVARFMVEAGYQVRYPYIGEDENGKLKVYDYVEEEY